MFAISRWPGPRAASRQDSKTGDLSLEALNARARERAALRTRQQSSGAVALQGVGSQEELGKDGDGRPHDRIGLNSIELKNDEVQAGSRKEKRKKKRQTESYVASGQNGKEPEDGVQDRSKKEIKKKREREVEGEAEGERREDPGSFGNRGDEMSTPDVHVIPGNTRKKKKKKKSCPTALGQCETFVDGEVSNVENLDVKRSAANGGTSPTEKIRKKTKRRDAEKLICEDRSVEIAAAAVDVSVPPRPSLDHASSAKDRNAKREALSEKADVDAAEISTELRRRKKGGGEVKAVELRQRNSSSVENGVCAFLLKTKKNKERASDTPSEATIQLKDGEIPSQKSGELSRRSDSEASNYLTKAKKKLKREAVLEDSAVRNGNSATLEDGHLQTKNLSGKGGVDAAEFLIEKGKKRMKQSGIDNEKTRTSNSSAGDLGRDMPGQSNLSQQKKKKKREAVEIHETEANNSPLSGLEVVQLERLSEHVEAADPSARMKSLRSKVAIEVSEGRDGVSEVEDVEVNKNEPPDPTDSIDLSRIQRDVDIIMGQAPSKSDLEEKKKGPPVLPWMREPVKIDSHDTLSLSQVPGLDIRLQDALRASGIQYLFQVQVAVWNETVGFGRCERDLCVCSPTGSGKTLSYALPIVQKLSSRVLRRLRALVVLPTRDLAVQVKGVFDTIAPSVGLKVGLAVGQTSVVAEAAELVKSWELPIHCFGSGEDSHDVAESCVDILVSTPGRLMDHLHNTRDFTLEHLLYLVVDETDRLLRQSYQDWLSNVLKAVAATEYRDDIRLTSASQGVDKAPVRALRTLRYVGAERGTLNRAHPRLMKMILSATLTRDPSKIAQLALHHPMYIAQSTLDTRYQLPEQLQAFRLVCKSGEKPLYLAALLEQLGSQQTIVFTASVLATHRLFLLLSFFESLLFKAVEYSSLQHQQARSKSLAKFRDGEVQVLVASDAMTRGMDVEGVANVINYDMPVYAKTYVHRVGRTARAGRVGNSFTILRKEEVRHFKSLLKKADNSSCKTYKLPATSVEGLHEQYLTALEKLKQVTREESASKTPTARVRGGDQTKGGSTEEQITGPDELFM